MSTTIGILSDTHGLLRPEVIQRLHGCDRILHAGDVNRPELLDALRAIAPLHVVRGNNDKEWAQDLPTRLTIEVEGLRILMVHNRRDLPGDLDGIQAIVFGHSHKYLEQTIDGRLWLNPGSCGRRRFNQDITFAIMRVAGEACAIEKVAIPHS